MFIEKKMMETGAVNMSMGVDEFYALVDYFAPDDIVRNAVLNSLELLPSRLQNRNFLMGGYAALMADNVLETRFDDSIGLHEFNANDRLVSLMGYQLGMIITELSSYVLIEVSLGTGYIAMSVLSNDDGAWVALWKSGDSVSLLGGFDKHAEPETIRRKIIPFIDKSANGQPFNLNIRRFALDQSIMLGTSMYGGTGNFRERIPSNAILENRLPTVMVNTMRTEYMYTTRDAGDRIADIMEVI